MRPLAYYAAWRDRVATTDPGLARALTADLARHGWQDPPAPADPVVADLEEPARRGPGRPRRETARHEADERAIPE